MTHLAFARKWRPQKFSEVVGQEHVTRTLRNAILQNRIHHAYLFAGPRGVGKTTTARIFAKAVNCEQLRSGEPCDECEQCVQILDGRSMNVLEIDGASNNSVEDVRTLRENAKYPPVSGRYKIYIIDEVHMLSHSAFNALLKILEEPPEHLLFIFATTDPQKVLPTITSRCQRFDFRRMTIAEITQQLQKIATAENVAVDEDALFAIARKADGSMRDAESIFEQLVNFGDGVVNYEAVREVFNMIDHELFFATEEVLYHARIAALFELVENLVERGYDFFDFLIGLTEHYRHLLVVKAMNAATSLPVGKEWQDRYFTAAQRYTQEALVNILSLLTAAEQQLRYSPNPRVFLEVLLSKIAFLDKALDLAKLLSQSNDANYGTEKVKTGAVSESTVKPQTPKTQQQRSAVGRTEQSEKSDLTVAAVYEAIQESEQLRGIRKLLLDQRLVKISVVGNTVQIDSSDSFVGETLARKQKEFAQILSHKVGKAISIEIIGLQKPTIGIFDDSSIAEPEEQEALQSEYPRRDSAFEREQESEEETQLKALFDLKEVRSKRE